MFEIKPYSDHYNQAVIELIVSIQRDEYDMDITADDQPDLNDVNGFYRRGAGNFWIATVGEEVVGTIALIDIGNQQGAMRKMFVNKDYRGSQKGVAARLITVLEDWAKEHGFNKIFLGTRSQFVAAHYFYAKYGYTEIAKADLPASFPVMAVDDRFFVKAL